MIYDKIGPGKNAPKEVHVVIEIPMGSSVKYEIDKETGLVFVDRILFTSMHYPFNYGFIPGTLEEDGDPVDVLVLGYESLYPGVIIKARPIGVLETEDEKGRDAKIVAVPVEKIDPRFENIKDINDLPENFRDRIAHFFEHYKELEKGKWVKVIGWKSREDALNRIRDAIERYKRSM
ncbi:Inorganic pyrophosphatase [Staphylothermus marinus F1]|uniref:Inorganic pyrophosphatase n=1 Tax=Staphylothermus marinus (strain ATCC 43588 / DSM 3639 / JCM 9404 / F1) TaxID=399550 RepID=A3DLS2_STAMF|nr:inorganic diphosphatase [Staphylothermus marinus]ABN69582.1 Inorganic pyrophosphatase [Staphylothermus marinus F1]